MISALIELFLLIKCRIFEILFVTCAKNFIKLKLKEGKI